MPLIKYEDKNFRAETYAIIDNANSIIGEYERQGFNLTLRQLYYQFVSRGLLGNNDKNYNKLGNIVSDARRAGLIDWDSIVDRTRYLRKLSQWNKPQDILESAVKSYHKNLWEGQEVVVEVWIEKDALVGVIEDVCNQYDTPYFSCRGYVSDSEMWSAAMRQVSRYDKYNQQTVILHLGDHDPSGIDMTRDIESRIRLFTKDNVYVVVNRIALTDEQIREVNPPPNPAKITDSRYESYVKEYGTESYELDALEPRYITNLISENIEIYRNENIYNYAYNRQEEEREKIKKLITNL